MSQSRVMKAFVCCWLLAWSCSAQIGFMDRTMRAIVPQGLIGYWPMDAVSVYGLVAPDFSGNGRNVVASNAVPAYALTNGVSRTAVRFNGVNQEFRGTDAGFPIHADARTFCGWIKFSAVKAVGYMGWFRYGSLANNGAWAGTAQDTGGAVGGLAIWDAGGNIGTVSPDNYGNDVWHHVAIKINDIFVRAIYIDGVEYGGLREYSYGNTWTVLSGIFRIGGLGDDWDAGGKFVGCLQDVRLYNRVLTPAEVGQLYRAGH